MHGGLGSYASPSVHLSVCPPVCAKILEKKSYLRNPLTYGHQIWCIDVIKRSKVKRVMVKAMRFKIIHNFLKGTEWSLSTLGSYFFLQRAGGTGKMRQELMTADYA